MQKKLIEKILICSIFILVTAEAYAVQQNAFENIYMTDNTGSYTEKTTFALNETPWLYVKFPHPGFHESEYMWKESLGTNTYSNENISNDFIEDWYPLSNWESIKKPGNWDVFAAYAYPASDPFPLEEGVGHSSFSVTPEPVSTLLFLTGGAVLAVKNSRRKKQTA